MERLNNDNYEFPVQPVQTGTIPGVRPLVDAEATGEVDPTR